MNLNIPKINTTGLRLLIRLVKFALLSKGDQLEIRTEKHQYTLKITGPAQGDLTSDNATSPQGKVNIIGAYKDGRIFYDQLGEGQCFVYQIPGAQGQGVKTSAVLQIALTKGH